MSNEPTNNNIEKNQAADGAKHAAPEEKKGNRTGRIVLAVIAVALLAAYFAIPAVHEWVNNVVAMFKTGNFDDMRDFIGMEYMVG